MKNLLLLLSLLASSVLTFSQIVYTNLEPELNMVVLENGSFASTLDSIDVNQDSTFDLKLSLSYSYSFVSPHFDESFQFSFRSLDSSSQVATDIGPYCKLAPFTLSDTIGSQLTWMDNGSGMVINPVFNIQCNRFPSDHYVGFRIHKNESYYYGWLLLQTGAQLMDVGGVSSAYAKISGYAYNMTPKYGLLAGDTISSIQIPDSFPDTLNVSKGIKLQLLDHQLTLICEEPILNIRVYDISARLLYSGKNLQESKATIDCSQWRPGCYIVQVKRKSSNSTVKFVLLDK
ncbi:MAG: T9SS type A sorting domain-containing protein [Bacteroidales bacterium]|nr:T9SS type A sorting domain-containing protein [Bacteroidales bacterium]